jgi:Sec-independent protein translocase protein TatA
MFGIGFEELLLFLLVVFLISPKDIPKVMKKIGSFLNELNRLKQEVLSLRKDIEDIAKEARITDDELGIKKKKSPKIQKPESKKQAL